MEIRYGQPFGTGTLLGDNNDNFFSKSRKKQATQIGWSHACPTVPDVIKAYGAEWTRNRYAECNFVFQLIVDSAKKFNPRLYIELTSPVMRLPDEPVGVFNPKFAPISHITEMSPLSTLWGYALPRVTIEQMGRGEKNMDRTPEKISKALDIIDETVKESTNPIELLVKIAECVSNLEADPKEVLSHLLASGVLHEENCETMFREVVQQMQTLAPNLNYIYKSLSHEEKVNLGIAVI